MEAINVKCNRCKCYRTESSFNKNGRIMKTCLVCREKSNKNRIKNHCIHNRRKNRCKDCGGTSICIHNRIKSQCKECGGGSICIHNRIKSSCKECGGGSICIHKKRKSICKECGGSQICIHNRVKPNCKECGGSQICIHNRRKTICKECGDEIKITIKSMVSSSKKSDKKRNHYDIVNFIDKCFVKNLIEDCEDKCYYCKCELQYVIRQSNLATIERLDNSLGHIKSNCVIACFKCNVGRVGDKFNNII